MKTLLTNKKLSRLLVHQGERITGVIMNELLPDLSMSYDWNYHIKLYLQHFIQANISNRPLIFSRFLDWSKIVEFSRFQSDRATKRIGQSLIDYIHNEFNNSEADELEQFINHCLTIKDPETKNIEESRLDEDSEFYLLQSEYFYALLKGDKKHAFHTIKRAIDDDILVKDLYLQVFQPSLYEIGRLWQLNKISVAQEHYFTAATELIMSQLYPHIFSTERNGKKMISTAVGGNLHELGIRMVSDLFEMEGWDTCYIGAGCPVDEIILEVNQKKADLLVLSVSMASLLDESRKLIQYIKQNDQCRNLPVLIGGRAFDDYDEMWKEVGADGYTAHIENAPAMATEMVETLV